MFNRIIVFNVLSLFEKIGTNHFKFSKWTRAFYLQIFKEINLRYFCFFRSLNCLYSIWSLKYCFKCQYFFLVGRRETVSIRPVLQILRIRLFQKLPSVFQNRRIWFCCRCIKASKEQKQMVTSFSSLRVGRRHSRICSSATSLSRNLRFTYLTDWNSL